jgi:hypothetical protein
LNADRPRFPGARRHHLPERSRDDGETGPASTALVPPARVLAVVPVPTSACPPGLRWPLGVRAAATATALCPACGAERAVTPDPYGGGAIAGMAHDSDCPAVDSRLEELDERHVEMRVIAIDPAMLEDAA